MKVCLSVTESLSPIVPSIVRLRGGKLVFPVILPVGLGFGLGLGLGLGLGVADTVTLQVADTLL